MKTFASMSGTTNLSGSVTLTFTVPGTFAGGDATQPTWSGLTLKEAQLWFGNPTNGDQIVSITVQDLAGVIPVPARAAYPLYPIIGTWAVTGLSSQYQGRFLLPNGPTSIIPANGVNNVPSQISIVGVFQKGIGLLTDTIYCNLEFAEQT